MLMDKIITICYWAHEAYSPAGELDIREINMPPSWPGAWGSGAGVQFDGLKIGLKPAAWQTCIWSWLSPCAVW